MYILINDSVGVHDLWDSFCALKILHFAFYMLLQFFSFLQQVSHDFNNFMKKNSFVLPLQDYGARFLSFTLKRIISNSQGFS